MKVPVVSNRSEVLTLPHGDMFVQWRPMANASGVVCLPVHEDFTDRDVRRAFRKLRRRRDHRRDFNTRAALLAYVGNLYGLHRGWFGAEYYTDRDPAPVTLQVISRDTPPPMN